MYYYKIYGLIVKSDYRFEEAYELDGNVLWDYDVEIKSGALNPAIATETELDRTIKGISLYHFERERGWIRAKGQGCCEIEQGKKITYQLKENHNPLNVNQMLLCAALPTLLIQRGDIALHGSCVLFGEKAIVISGNSGAGKSTLTEELLECGSVFMADDTVALKVIEGKVYAEAAYPQQKICTDTVKESTRERGQMVLLPPDGGKEKYAVRLKTGYCMEEKELNSMFILNVGDVETVAIEEITGSEKIKYLMDNLYKRKVYIEVGMSVEIFKKCVEVANKVKIYKIVRPKEGMTTDIQMAKIKEILGL